MFNFFSSAIKHYLNLRERKKLLYQPVFICLLAATPFLPDVPVFFSFLFHFVCFWRTSFTRYLTLLSSSHWLDAIFAGYRTTLGCCFYSFSTGELFFVCFVSKVSKRNICFQIVSLSDIRCYFHIFEDNFYPSSFLLLDCSMSVLVFCLV